LISRDRNWGLEPDPCLFSRNRDFFRSLLGWYTVHLSLFVGAEGRVDAFEPRSDLMDLLTKTLAENRLTNVTVHNFALGSQIADGQVIWDPQDVNPGGTHLTLPDFASSGIISQPVLIKTLDSCVSHSIDFIKIDVEGLEFLVFKGAERILTKDRPVILIEINPANLLRTSGISAEEFGQYLTTLNYRLFEIGADGSCAKQIQTFELSTIKNLMNVTMLPAEQTQSKVAIYCSLLRYFAASRGLSKRQYVYKKRYPIYGSSWAARE